MTEPNQIPPTVHDPGTVPAQPEATPENRPCAVGVKFLYQRKTRAAARCGLAVRVPARGTGEILCGIPGFSGKGDVPYLAPAASYLATILAGTRPRSLTLSPCSLAQARIFLLPSSSEAVRDMRGLRGAARDLASLMPTLA